MDSRLNPYLAFDGNARQAMEFYQEVLGGDLVLGTYGDYGASDAPAGRVMHAVLDTPDGYRVMGWDVRDGMRFDQGNNVALYLGGTSTRIRDYFTALAEGGTVTIPLRRQSWGDEAGALVDRFGITWMVNITAPRS